MSQQIRSCKHSKAEEQYICLEASCLSNKELKLDCLRCLMQAHPHSENITHIQEILIEAQTSQQQFNEKIELNLQFCVTQKLKVEFEIEEKRKKMNDWFDQIKKHAVQEIEEYEKELKNHKQKITSVQVTKVNLKDLVDFKHMNIQSYELQNELYKKALEYNSNSFNEYFKNQFERIGKNYLLKVANLKQLPQMEKTFITHRIINYEKCTVQGCSGIEKSKLCLEKTCLLKNNLALECPQCLTSQHWSDRKFESHNKQFVQANELWDLQNKYIDEVEQFCDTKQQDIQKESSDLQSLIIECQKLNEIKLQQFMQFIIEKENQIIEYLTKFKSMYQKDKFVIYKDLLLQTDFSVLADIVQLEFSFKNISEQFKKQYQNELNYNQQQFQDLWLKGSCLIQQENILKQSQKCINPIGLKIQELQNQITLLEQQKCQNAQFIEGLKKQLDHKQNDFDKTLMSLVKENGRLEQIQNNFAIFSQNLRNSVESLNDDESEELLNCLQQLNRTFDNLCHNTSTRSNGKRLIGVLQEKIDKQLNHFKGLQQFIMATDHNSMTPPQQKKNVINKT